MDLKAFIHNYFDEILVFSNIRQFCQIGLLNY